MELLVGLKCVACRADSPRVTEEEIARYQPQIADWQLIEHEGMPKLQRIFSCSPYTKALKFTQMVGELADAEDHHPAILTEYNKVTVTWWTYAIDGLHRNDFIAAAKTDQLYQNLNDSASPPAPLLKR